MRFIIHESLGDASQIGFSETMNDETRQTTADEVSDLSVKIAVRAGRPTREQAEARQLALLECALVHFLDKGFESTTIEAIAADVSMTKRTVYARYPDKVALFRAVIRHATEKHAASDQRIKATLRNTLKDTLVEIARLRIQLVREGDGAKLQRLINTESYRFPDIINIYYEIAALPTVRFLADILEHESRAGRLTTPEPLLAANVFMSMVVSGPVRFILSGNRLEDEAMDQRILFAINLFLKGAEPR